MNLIQGIQTKAALLAEGKPPEEILVKLGETRKLDAEKLKYFFNALEVAEKNTEGLKRVIVISVGEGEKAPSKAVEIEDMHYVAEFYGKMSQTQPKKDRGKDGKGKRGGDNGGRGSKRDAKPATAGEKA